MTTTSSKSHYLRGLRTGLPFILVAGPFSLLFGVVATEAGLNLLEVMGFTSIVIAGAAQFAALQQMTDNAPVIVILATALAVNLRMAMYSAALAPHIGKAPLWQRALASFFLFDQNYAVSVLEFEKNPGMTPQQRIAFYFGITCAIVPAWITGTYIGAVVGTAIPPEYALDFALPITFLSMIGPALRTPAHMAAAFVSVLAALIFAFLPYNLGLMTAAILAMMTGARVEIWLIARGKWS
ncbi:AzlC family ABC transporter permease [Halocynthiibacter sp.]|uniref:AzlC family ABC transporter permease n=1 Tax=Halocynthiibacter sp. TaxID=1979210 RepID=UPI003C365EAF